jgi:D-alanyl-D-alanine carboxypeptidase/D-alanyl-D-alanine-endopeptidase (penicillin-binding protein 4)
MKTFFLGFSLLISNVSFGQKPESRLADAYKVFEADGQFKHALISLFIVETNTGKVLFDKNSQIGLAPASCLKVVTSAAAFELLGKDYRYKTDFKYDGNLIVKASGDPTLGSWRWNETKEEAIVQKLAIALKERNIASEPAGIVIDDSQWETQATPKGWIWEDIGNYYGAGARGLNWHENQYDLILMPGKNTGDSVEIAGTEPDIYPVKLISELKTGKSGSGDNSIIYLPEDGLTGVVRGTVPAGNKNFKVSGSMPSPSVVFKNSLQVLVNPEKAEVPSANNKSASRLLMTHLSPSLDSINYWFLQKSINLYGEALVKTIAYEKTGFGATDTGIIIIKDLWARNGIEKSELHMVDGCGLSPANRITTNALVTVMQFAKKQNWYSAFYNALPEQNGLKMKSGYIGGVRSYTGYIKSKTGTEYSFSFIINNFDGNPGTVREKMWKLLDILK